VAVHAADGLPYPIKHVSTGFHVLRSLAVGSLIRKDAVGCSCGSGVQDTCRAEP